MTTASIVNTVSSCIAPPVVVTDSSSSGRVVGEISTTSSSKGIAVVVGSLSTTGAALVVAVVRRLVVVVSSDWSSPPHATAVSTSPATSKTSFLMAAPSGRNDNPGPSYQRRRTPSSHPSTPIRHQPTALSPPSRGFRSPPPAFRAGGPIRVSGLGSRPGHRGEDSRVPCAPAQIARQADAYLFFGR